MTYVILVGLVIKGCNPVQMIDEGIGNIIRVML